LKRKILKSAFIFLCLILGNTAIIYAQNSGEENVKNPKDEQYIAYIEEGYKKFDSGDFKGAIKDFSKALELNPADYLAFFNRATAKQEIADFKGAIQDFAQAIKIKPDKALLYLNRAFLSEQLKDFSQAIVDYKKVIELDSKEAYAYAGLGFIMLNYPEHFDFVQGLEYAKKAVELNKNDIFLTTLALGYALNRNFFQAVKYQKEAYELNPNESYLELLTAYENNMLYPQWKEKKNKQNKE
jgi:tetratricopeptide (TPR) repeat protein